MAESIKTGEVYYEIGVKLGKFVDGIAEAKHKATGLGKEFDKMAAKLEKAANKVAGFGKKLTIGLTLPIVTAGAAAIKLSASVAESLDKIDVVFRNTSQEIKDFSDTTLKQFGISKGSALEMAGVFGGMADAMGATNREATDMSKELVGLAGDMASFNDVSVDRVNTALKGVFTGEGEALKSLSIVMQDATLIAFANEKGMKKNFKTMTQAEKVALRFQFVMEKTSIQQGNFSDTSGSAANQIKTFGETMKEVGENFGSVILPLFTQIITKVNEFLLSISELNEGTKEFIITALGVAAAIGPVIFIVGKMIAAYRAAIIVITAFRVGMAGQALATGASTTAIIANRVAVLAVAAATKIWNLVLKANPLVLVISLVVGLGAAVLALSERYKAQTYEEQRSAEAKQLLINLNNGLVKSTKAATEEVNLYVSAIRRQGATDAEVNRKLRERNIFLKQQIELAARGSNTAQVNAKVAAEEIAANNKVIRSLRLVAQQRTTNQKQASSKERQKAFTENLQKVKELARLQGKTEIEILTLQKNDELAEIDKYSSKALKKTEDFKKAQLAINEDFDKRSFDKLRANVDNVLSVFSELGNGAQALYNAFAERRAQDIEDRFSGLTAAELEYNAFLAEQEKERFDNLSDAEKKEFNLKKNADKSRIELDKKKQKALRKLAREQAIVEKIGSLFSIAANTAKAIMQAFGQFGPALGIPWAVAMGVAGGIQTAAVLTAPLPKAKHGIFADSPFIGGEAGPELAFPLSSIQGRKAQDLFADRLLNSIAKRQGGNTTSTSSTPDIQQAGIIAPSEQSIIIKNEIHLNGNYMEDWITDGLENKRILIPG